MLVSTIWACNLSVFGVETWIQNKMATSNLHFHLGNWIRKKSMRKLTKNDKLVKWVTICSTTNSRFVQWVPTCSHHEFVLWDPCASHHKPQVCTVVDHVLLESREEQVKEPPEPTQQELVVQASEEAGFAKGWSILRNKTGMRCLRKKHCTVLQVIHQTNDYQRSMIIRNIHETFSSQRIKVHCELTFEYRRRCIVLHGYEKAAELRNGHASRQISHQNLKETSPTPSPRSRSAHPASFQPRNNQDR